MCLFEKLIRQNVVVFHMVLNFAQLVIVYKLLYTTLLAFVANAKVFVYMLGFLFDKKMYLYFIVIYTVYTFQCNILFDVNVLIYL